MPHAIDRLFATPKTTPRIPRITPAVTPTERVRSIKASLISDGGHCAVPVRLASLGAHGKDEAFVNRHKMCEFAHTCAWSLGVFGLDLLSSVNPCRGSRKLSVSLVPPLSDCLADLSDLRRFGVALARDDRFVLDHASAAALVDRLFKQA